MRYARATNDVFAIQEAESTLGLVLATGGRAQDARRALLGAMFTSDGSEMGCAYQGLGELFARLERIQPGPPSSPEVALAAFDAGTPGDVGAVEEGDTAAHQTARALLHLFDRRTDEAKALLPSLDPADADVLRGHLLVARKDSAGATEALTGALDRLDGHPRTALLRHLAWLGLGWAANNAGRYADADGWFDKLLAEVPRHRLGLLGKANARSWLGDGEGSEALLREVLADDPGNPYALAEIAGIQLDRGELDAAEATYKAAMEQTGDAYTCPWEGLGLVYLQRGQLDAAEQHLEQAIAINPDIEFRKYNALAKVLLSRGEDDRARELLRKSIANYPHDPEAARMLAELEGAPASP